jgi:pyruvate kinase
LAAELADAGAAAFRLNASHMSPDALLSLAGPLRGTLPDHPIIIDLQGAKMRLGEFAEQSLREGERLRFAFDGSGGSLPLRHREIYAAVSSGEVLGCDDDRIRFRVDAVRGQTLDVTVLTGGVLRPRKGINILEHPVILRDLQESDVACIRATAGLGRVAFAFSFMTDGREAEWIRRRAPGCEVVGKIERREAAEKALAISQTVESLWICRGDLGAQLGVAAMARWVAAYEPRSAGRPVYMAGQVMEHLTRHGAPTRAEVCHAYDLLERGYAGFVLSDETAIGNHPVQAVRTLNSLLRAFAG